LGKRKMRKVIFTQTDGRTLGAQSENLWRVCLDQTRSNCNSRENCCRREIWHEEDILTISLGKPRWDA
jgi:hypothetical protein